VPPSMTFATPVVSGYTLARLFVLTAIQHVPPPPRNLCCAHCGARLTDRGRSCPPWWVNGPVTPGLRTCNRRGCFQAYNKASLQRTASISHRTRQTVWLPEPTLSLKEKALQKELVEVNVQLDEARSQLACADAELATNTRRYLKKMQAVRSNHQRDLFDLKKVIPYPRSSSLQPIPSSLCPCLSPLLSTDHPASERHPYLRA
jgi:hypothetical protein